MINNLSKIYKEHKDSSCSCMFLCNTGLWLTIETLGATFQSLWAQWGERAGWECAVWEQGVRTGWECEVREQGVIAGWECDVRDRVRVWGERAGWECEVRCKSWVREWGARVKWCARAVWGSRVGGSVRFESRVRWECEVRKSGESGRCERGVQSEVREWGVRAG